MPPALPPALRHAELLDEVLDGRELGTLDDVEDEERCNEMADLWREMSSAEQEIAEQHLRRRLRTA